MRSGTSASAQMAFKEGCGPAHRMCYDSWARCSGCSALVMRFDSQHAKSFYENFNMTLSSFSPNHYMIIKASVFSSTTQCIFRLGSFSSRCSSPSSWMLLPLNVAVCMVSHAGQANLNFLCFKINYHNLSFIPCLLLHLVTHFLILL